jgi:hypothetical protein
LAEIKSEIEELRERPNIDVSTEAFYEDYCLRKSKGQSELDLRELEKEKQKVVNLTQERNNFLQVANRILENMRIRRYALDEPVISKEKAQKKITELLEQKEKELEDYLSGENE